MKNKSGYIYEGSEDLEIDPAISLGTNAGQLGLIGDPGNDRLHFLFEAHRSPFLSKTATGLRRFSDP